MSKVKVTKDKKRQSEAFLGAVLGGRCRPPVLRRWENTIKYNYEKYFRVSYLNTFSVFCPGKNRQNGDSI